MHNIHTGYLCYERLSNLVT